MTGQDVPVTLVNAVFEKQVCKINCLYGLICILYAIHFQICWLTVTETIDHPLFLCLAYVPDPFLLFNFYTVQCHSLFSVFLHSASNGRLQSCICNVRLIFSRVGDSDKDRFVPGGSYLRSEKSRNFVFKKLSYI